MNLTPKQKEVLDLRKSGHTYQSIGKKMGFSYKRARALHYEALRRERAKKAALKIAPPGFKYCPRCKRVLRESEFLLRQSATGPKLRTYCRNDEAILCRMRQKSRDVRSWEPVISLDKLAQICEQKRLARLAAKEDNY